MLRRDSKHANNPLPCQRLESRDLSLEVFGEDHALQDDGAGGGVVEKSRIANVVVGEVVRSPERDIEARFDIAQDHRQ